MTHFFWINHNFICNGKVPPWAWSARNRAPYLIPLSPQIKGNITAPGFWIRFMRIEVPFRTLRY